MSARPPWLPTETQELLLRAALLEDEDALEAWRAWTRASLSVEDEMLAFQALPLAYRRISPLDPDADKLELAKGVYRYVWVKNQVLVRFGGEVIRLLQSEGIDVLVLKGAALSLLHYGDPGLRLMQDIDLLVPREEATHAVAVMNSSLKPKQAPLAADERVLVEHGSAWVDGSGSEVDVHWYSLWLSSPDAEFWRGAVAIEVDGVSSRSLCPTDHLLHVCAHGASWHPRVALRWVTDAVTVIRSSPAIDWDRLVRQAREREVTITLADALSYLRSTFGVEVPTEVIGRLRAAPTTLATRAARRALTRPPTMTGVLASHWDRYSRLKRLDPDAPRPASFPSYLRTTWGFDTYGDLLRHAARRGLGLRPRSGSWQEREARGLPSPDS